MRNVVLVACVLALALPVSASAGGHAAGSWGPPLSHGPDFATVVDRGAEVPGPAGGPTGKPLTPKRRAKLTGGNARFRLPTGWCGTARSDDDREHEVDNGAYRYHAIYALPADGTDRFAQFADAMQTDAFQASALLEQSYGRAIRFDLGTSCGPQYLDISVVRLPQTTAQLAATAGTLQAVADGIDAAGFGTIRPTDTVESASVRKHNYVVWLDGPTAPDACGVANTYADSSRAADNANNLGGKVAVVFPNGAGGFCSSNSVRHEIGHNLGALLRNAPHAFDGAHCDDAYEDTMCYSQSPSVASGQHGQFFDYGNDDYWDPPNGPGLPWWTANLNRFLCPDAACNVAVDGPDAPVAENACPSVGDACAPGTLATRSFRTLTVRIKARRVRSGWKVTVTARGRGKGLVTLRCRRRPGGAVRTVMSKRTALPRTLRRTVRCTTPPRAAITGASREPS